MYACRESAYGQVWGFHSCEHVRLSAEYGHGYGELGAVGKYVLN